MKLFGILALLVLGQDAEILACDFEDPEWWKAWGLPSAPRNAELVPSGRGNCLKVKVLKGDHYGTSFVYSFKKGIGSEPEEVYFRYLIKFDPDWKNATYNGKLPGFGGTYGKAGWGGRPVNGKDGWSARGCFDKSDASATTMGYYCYHADMKGQYGNIWEFKPRLNYDTWYCVEMYCRMNAPGRKDGVLRTWIDGRPAFEKTDLRFRDVPNLKIECVWFDIYHGGPDVPKADIHVYFDSIVVSRKPIGVPKK